MTDPIDTPAPAGTPEAATAPTDAIVTPAATALPRKPLFAGYTAPQLLVGAALLLALVWAMWITKAVTADKPQHIVKADLSRIVGEYVQAQARSATPPDQVQAQMKAFMASLDGELQRRGASGQVVLVGEAVLSKSVPDITAEVAKAVYASGVKVPSPASQSQMGAMLRGQAPVAAAAAPIETAQAPALPIMTDASPFGAAPAPVAAPVSGEQLPIEAPAGAAVSTFGGPVGQ